MKFYGEVRGSKLVRDYSAVPTDSGKLPEHMESEVEINMGGSSAYPTLLTFQIPGEYPIHSVASILVEVQLPKGTNRIDRAISESEQAVDKVL
jgi:hypothetical protein